MKARLRHTIPTNTFGGERCGSNKNGTNACRRKAKTQVSNFCARRRPEPWLTLQSVPLAQKISTRQKESKARVKCIRRLVIAFKASFALYENHSGPARSSTKAIVYLGGDKLVGCLRGDTPQSFPNYSSASYADAVVWNGGES